MNIQDLAKDLDQLARSLRNASDEVRAEIVRLLELERLAHSCDGGGKYRPKPLTVGAITNALALAQRQSGRRAENLRSDVFDRRVKKLTALNTDALESKIRRGSGAATAGVRFSLSQRNPTAGVRNLTDVMPGWFRRSIVDAEVSAWINASENVVHRLVPAYGYDALRRAANDRYPDADRYVTRLRDWVTSNVILICNVDAQGIPTSVLGVDPAPFFGLAEKLAAGDTDPARIIRSVPAPAEQTGNIANA